MTGRERRGARLSAFLDGELRGARARRLTRRLERSPELAEEVRQLREVGDLVRESQGMAPAAPPDLWGRVARALPAIDAELAEQRARRRFGLGLPAGLARPLAAGLAVAGVAAVLAFGLLRPAPVTSDVVHWLDAQGSPVMVLQAEDDTTIIWVLDPAEEFSEGRVRGLA